MWCPGCSQEVESKCHHWMCPIARDERTGTRQMIGLVERLRAGVCDDLCKVKEARSGCQCAEAADRIEALEVALNYVADMTYCGTDAEWHFKPGYDPQGVLDALAPEQKK